MMNRGAPAWCRHCGATARWRARARVARWAARQAPAPAGPHALPAAHRRRALQSWPGLGARAGHAGRRRRGSARGRRGRNGVGRRQREWRLRAMPARARAPAANAAPPLTAAAAAGRRGARWPVALAARARRPGQGPWRPGAGARGAGGECCAPKPRRQRARGGPLLARVEERRAANVLLVLSSDLPSPVMPEGRLGGSAWCGYT